MKVNPWELYSLTNEQREILRSIAGTSPRVSKKWFGKRDVCQICNADISNEPFVDGKTIRGPWAIMCLDCHKENGGRIGLGLGQMYDEKGEKIAG